MASPFTSTTVTNYNANPPADDGSAVAANQVKWSTIKTKLSDPLNTFASAVNSALTSAFAKLIGSAGILSTGISYSVLSADQGKLIKATASSITITTPDATDVQSPFSFSVLNNSSGSVTVDGFSAQTVDGAASITVPAGGGVRLETDGTNWFTDGQNFIGTQVIPQGRLTLTSGAPIMNADVSAGTAVYYTPYTGNLVPVYNGTLFQMRSFAELTLTLQANSNYAASAIYDCFIFDSSGTVTFGIGPAWSTATAGSGARGTGAGTTELQRINGLWTNKNSMTARNAGSTYTVAANQGTYVGSIHMDASNGQVTFHASYGQNRKAGIWNAYNRVLIVLKAGDSTASWSYGTASFRASNNSPSTWASASFNVGSGTACNGINVFTGLAEEPFTVDFHAKMATNANGSIGIGLNSVTAASGYTGATGSPSASNLSISPAKHINPPSLGLNTICALENALGGSATSFLGTNANMQLSVLYQG